MAGGTESRFWPVSSHSNPKQFIDILGNGKSMLQSTFERFKRICPQENIIIVTTESNTEQVRQQLPDLLDYQVLSEPLRRNTAPCVAYAASVINEINPQASIIVTPSDHAIINEDLFVQNINKAIEITSQHGWIVTMGIKPSNPNTKYGYIQFAEGASLAEVPNLHKVVTFTEKPPIEMAIQFLLSGEFFWNAGVFIWSLPVLMEAYRTHLPIIAENLFSLTAESSKEEILSTYSQIDPISIDNGIMEKASNVYVMEANFGWSDLETWDSLYQSCPKDQTGNAIAKGNVLLYDCKDCVVHIPTQKTVILQGLEDYIVTANDEVLMICRKNQEQTIPKYASDFELLRKKKHF